jgi:hypothetical protein
MAVEVSSGSSGIAVCLRSGSLRADLLRADSLRADRGGGPSFVGLFSGVSGFINLFDQTLNFNFEFQYSFCLKFLHLQTQVFSKRVYSGIDFCSCNTGIAKRVYPCLMVCSCNTGIAKRISSCLYCLLLKHRYCKANSNDSVFTQQ